MIDVEAASTYPLNTTQLWSAGADYPAGAEEEVAGQLEIWARRHGVQALVKHEPGRVGMTTGGWTFPLKHSLPKMPPGGSPLWGAWLSGEPVGIAPHRYAGITALGMCVKLRRAAEVNDWTGVVRIFGGNVYACLDPHGQMTELEAHRKMVKALVGATGRMQYPWGSWAESGRRHVAVYGLDFAIPPEQMRTVILNHYRRRGMLCRTELVGSNVQFSHEPLGYDGPDAQDAPTQEV